MPIRDGSTPISAALARTTLTARCPSWAAASHGRDGSRAGTRYFSKMPVTPMAFSHSTTSVPSRSHARIVCPPPGATITAAPVSPSSGGLKTDRVGWETFVIRVTRRPLTSLSSGRVRSCSGPRSPASSGGLSGHSRQTTGSAAAAEIVKASASVRAARMLVMSPAILAPRCPVVAPRAIPALIPAASHGRQTIGRFEPPGNPLLAGHVLHRWRRACGRTALESFVTDGMARWPLLKPERMHGSG